MKTIFIGLCFASFSSLALGQNTVSLNGGSTATIEANVKTTVTCEASKPKFDKPICKCETNILEIIYPDKTSSWVNMKSPEICFEQAFSNTGLYSQICSGK